MRLRYTKEEQIIRNTKAVAVILFMILSILGAGFGFAKILFVGYSLKWLICGVYFTTAFLFSYNLTQKL